MKKFIFLSCALLSALMVSAGTRSIQEARRLVSSQQVLRHVFTAPQRNGQPAFYVFNKGENGGFVIVSAEENGHSVLGYSDTGSWDSEDIPEALQALMEIYADELSIAATNRAPQQTNATYTPISPICQTQWGQKSPFNLFSPTWQGNNCVAGCVATMASQLMKVYEYPTKGIGSNSYKWANENGDSVLLSADFSGTTYKWSQMVNTYSSTSTQSEKEAVARLVQHCGISANMAYGESKSSAVTKDMINSLITHFGYDKGVKMFMKDYMSEQALLDTIITDLKAGHPVVVSAKTVRNTGHAFICDGLDKYGMLHVNWGWYGKSDGYYRLSAFTPQEQGTGGSATNDGYIQKIQVFTHIFPDAGGAYYPSFTCDNVRIPEPRIAKTEKAKFIVDTLSNRGFATWNGNLALRIYKDGAFYKQRTIKDNKNPLKPGYRYLTASYNADFSSYPVGEYEVVMALRSDDHPNMPIPLWCKWMGEWRCKMTIQSDSIFFEVPTAMPPVEEEVLDPTTYDFTNLIAYYYPSKSSPGHHRWKFQLGTEGVYAKDLNADGDQMLLLFSIFCRKEPTDITDNFPAVTSSENGCFAAKQYCGLLADQENVVVTNASRGECTLFYDDEEEEYLMYYSVRLNGKDYSADVVLPRKRVKAVYGEDYETHLMGDRITLDTEAPEALETVMSDEEQPVRKVLEDGVLYIIRNGVRYDAHGRIAD